MRSSLKTKEKILSQATILFNKKGYKATSISDITTASGFTKGAVYRNFVSKEALEIESFQTMMKTIFSLLKEEIKDAKNTKDKLFCILKVFQTYITKPIIQGGCPLLNASIEVDDTHLELKIKAQQALQLLRSSVETIIVNGKKFNQVKSEVDEKMVAIILISSLEGGIMMSKLQNSDLDINSVVTFLKNWIEKEILV